MVSGKRPSAEYPRVMLRALVKSYPGVRALRGVDLEIREGEIHALCGENGAGKSTLIGILGGVTRPDSGEILLNGKPVRFRNPADALAQGVAVIHQEFSLVGPMSVAENLALGDEPRVGPWIDRRAIRRQGAQRLEALGFPVDPFVTVDQLTTGQRQLVEIAKALGREAEILVLDEPTAALTKPEVQRLFAILQDLKSKALAILYISHHLEEVAQIADRITVLRDGARVGTWPAVELPPHRLMAAMVGEVVDRRASVPRTLQGPPLLKIERAVGEALREVDLEVRAGEIVGLTGLAGSGHEELAKAAFGATNLVSGEMTWLSRPYRPRHPAEARALGIAYVPGDRRREGLIPTWGVTENVTIAVFRKFSRSGWLNRTRRGREAESLCRTFEVACSSVGQKVTTLSGGNQQKVLLARWAATEPKLLILNDPTRGIDVRTREVIHRRIEDLARSGLAVLLVTSDTHELFRLADRLVVLRFGRVVRDVSAQNATEQDVLAATIESSPPGERHES
jgi:ABC-type sugar transport system ATPase subunit